MPRRRRKPVAGREAGGAGPADCQIRQRTAGSAGRARAGIGGMSPEAGRSRSRAHQILMPGRFSGACSGTRPRPSRSALISTLLVADVARDIAQRRGRARANKIHIRVCTVQIYLRTKNRVQRCPMRGPGWRTNTPGELSKHAGLLGRVLTIHIVYSTKALPGLSVPRYKPAP